jgi:hypothetical protein
MGGLFLILPVLAFDIWLSWTTGRRQFRQWAGEGKLGWMACCLGIGILLAFVATFLARYNWGEDQRVQGFPIPLIFFHKEGATWTRTTLPEVMPYIGGTADFLTGLVAPLIPFKVAEFLKTVKAELK